VFLEGIVRITNLDVTAPIIKESNILLGVLSHCQVLLCYFRLSNSHQLITEVHQSNNIMGPVPVQAVIMNTPEAEQMILMMNKNVPAYIGNVLKD
jgi:hypothetical protein